MIVSFTIQFEKKRGQRKDIFGKKNQADLMTKSVEREVTDDTGFQPR